MKLTLTQPQQDLIELLLADVLEKQKDVATNTAKLAATKTKRDAAHAKLKSALAELGHSAGLPTKVAALAKDLEPDGTWAGKITVS